MVWSHTTFRAWHSVRDGIGSLLPLALLASCSSARGQADVASSAATNDTSADVSAAVGCVHMPGMKPGACCTGTLVTAPYQGQKAIVRNTVLTSAQCLNWGPAYVPGSVDNDGTGAPDYVYGGTVTFQTANGSSAEFKVAWSWNLADWVHNYGVGTIGPASAVGWLTPGVQDVSLLRLKDDVPPEFAEPIEVAEGPDVDFGQQATIIGYGCNPATPTTVAGPLVPYLYPGRGDAVPNSHALCASNPAEAVAACTQEPTFAGNCNTEPDFYSDLNHAYNARVRGDEGAAVVSETRKLVAIGVGRGVAPFFNANSPQVQGADGQPVDGDYYAPLYLGWHNQIAQVIQLFGQFHEKWCTPYDDGDIPNVCADDPRGTSPNCAAFSAQVIDSPRADCPAIPTDSAGRKCALPILGRNDNLVAVGGCPGYLVATYNRIGRQWYDKRFNKNWMWCAARGGLTDPYYSLPQCPAIGVQAGSGGIFDEELCYLKNDTDGNANAQVCDSPNPSGLGCQLSTTSPLGFVGSEAACVEFATNCGKPPPTSSCPSTGPGSTPHWQCDGNATLSRCVGGQVQTKTCGGPGCKVGGNPNADDVCASGCTNCQ
jgi:hypothetical protein